MDVLIPIESLDAVIYYATSQTLSSITTVLNSSVQLPGTVASSFCNDAIHSNLLLRPRGLNAHLTASQVVIIDILIGNAEIFNSFCLHLHSCRAVIQYHECVLLCGLSTRRQFTNQAV